MARRSPKGSRKLARQVSALKEKFGAKRTASLMGVHPATVNKIVRLHREHKPISDYMTSQRTMDRWTKRMGGVVAKVQKGESIKLMSEISRSFKDKAIAQHLGVSRQKATAMRQAIEAGQIADPKQMLKTLTEMKSELWLVGPHMIKGKAGGEVMFYPDRKKIPKGRQYVKSFADLDDALNWVWKVGGNAIYWSITTHEGDVDIYVDPEGH